jgi:RNA polymerase primary sigma factor
VADYVIYKNIREDGVMRLLTEYMSVPEVTGTVPAKNTETQVKPATVSNRSDSVENLNLKLAKKQEEHKSRLIAVLSKFPVTALWVISKYEHVANHKDDHEEEAGVPSELDVFLNDIKKHYYSFSQPDESGRLKEADYSSKKLRLATAVQQFPFAFEDLVKLVEIVVYAFNHRNLTLNLNSLSEFYNQQPQAKKHFDIVSNRLKAAAESGSIRLKKLFNTMNLQNFDEEFLLLSADEMTELFADVVLAEHYWLSYRQQLASANSKLVLFIANQYKGNFLDFDDMVQEGHSGLLKAVDRFKFRLGFQFSTYAGYWIRQAISRALSRSERVVRIPCGQIATINRLFRAKDELTLKKGKEPTTLELSEYTNISNDEVNTLLSIAQSSVSMDGYDDEEDEHSFAPIDFLEQKVFSQSYSMIADKQLTKLVNSSIKTLNAREAKILCSHFGIGNDQQKTLQEIGSELKLTRERVRQIQVVALNKIKMRYGEQLLSFL